MSNTLVQRAHSGTRAAERTASFALGLWGFIHVLGGGVLMASASNPASALTTLGSAAPPSDVANDPGAVVGALIGFHGMNLAFAGVAVLGLAVWSWRRWPLGVPTALAIAAVADLGLMVYLLVPGHMATADGAPGPILLAVALVAAVFARRSEEGTAS